MTFNQSSIPAVQIAIMYLLITSVYYYNLFKARRDHTVGDLLGILFPQAGTCCRHGAKSVPTWSCTPCRPAACRPWSCRACRHLPTASCCHSKHINRNKTNISREFVRPAPALYILTIKQCGCVGLT